MVLRGNLCPDGAVMKISAAEQRLLAHEGRAIVFEDIHDLAARVDDPDLDVDADTVMVLRNAGPVGAPGMPEWGTCRYRPSSAPGSLGSAGISDARMSGTSYGAVVLHVAPESAVGGPLALVQTGDRIRIDVERGRSTRHRRRRARAPARGLDTAGAQGSSRLPPALRGSCVAGERGLRPRLPPGSFARGLGRRQLPVMSARYDLRGPTALIAFLASEACSFSTGVVFDLSGGRATY